jgi:hypothetical protein
MTITDAARRKTTSLLVMSMHQHTLSRLRHSLKHSSASAVQLCGAALPVCSYNDSLPARVLLDQNHADSQ